MRLRGCLGIVALVAISFSMGCSTTGPVVRGQGPENTGPIIGSAPGYGELKRAPYLGHSGKHDFRPFNGARDNNFGYEGGFYAGPNGSYSDRHLPYEASPYGAGMQNGACPQCNNGQACPQGGCRHCGRGCMYKHGMPQHYQTYQYDWPQNMVYPQQGTPSGVVQYPYYTLRGPTDFFMK